ncbi:MAG TPA: B12-binding domain-containing radical SAM protein [Chitinispirillaceae bacterium]|nr:B12-binding domain-containing radical SAM protein [Chitinispirillaceae bacterium]
MSLKILVINPYITDFKLYDEWMHPAGLYFLMDILHKNGHKISYFNCLQHSLLPSEKYGTGRFNFEEIQKPALYCDIKRKYKRYGRPQNELREFLQSIPSQDIICVGSMMTYWALGVTETIQIVREVYPAVPIIIGGIAARLMPHYFSCISDNCITGELADPEIRALLQISKIPVPSFLTGFRALAKPATHGPVMISLGCPMNCSYCASKILQPTFRYRPLELILNEIDFMIEQLGVTDFAFYDDALLYNAEAVFIPFLKKIIERTYPIRFHTPNGLHLRFIQESLLKLMIKAGFVTIRFGYESGDQRYLHDISAKIRNDELTGKIKLIKQYCSEYQDIGIYIMGGLKDQTPQQMLAEMDFIGSLGIRTKPVFISPVPGTSLYMHYLKEFPMLQTDPFWHNDSFFITRLPAWSIEEVETVRKRAKQINSSLLN